MHRFILREDDDANDISDPLHLNQNECIFCTALTQNSASVKRSAFHALARSKYGFSRLVRPAAILYELLYGRVFQVDQGLLGWCQRLPRPTHALSDDNMAFCGSSEESDLDGGEAIW